MNTQTHPVYTCFCVVAVTHSHKQAHIAMVISSASFLWLWGFQTETEYIRLLFDSILHTLMVLFPSFIALIL